MKGVVFTEFLEMVESKFGFVMADSIVSETDLPSGGVYTALGTYSHKELLTMITLLSERSEIPIPTLVNTFGHYLLNSFTKIYPQFFADETEVFGFLRRVEYHIHMEVRKLYTETELPSFQFEMEGDNVMYLRYESHRPFADLAKGMIEATALYYNEIVEITSEDKSRGGKIIVRFRIQKVS